MPKFVFASDSFKGSLPSLQVAQLLDEAAQSAFPDAHTQLVAMADGGEGTVQAVVEAAGGTLHEVCVHGPLGGVVEAAYGLLDGGRAIIEMAAASGLPLVAPESRNPAITSTYGTGELIRDALSLGVGEITLGIGGSATNDGGMGCMRALGARFLDENGEELEGTGSDLGRVSRIDLREFEPRVAKTRFRVMCDVDNPLYGTRGATRVFAPQKGASPAQVEELEAGMQRYSAVLQEAFPTFDPMAAGMGAAGGLGAAACAFLQAEMLPGIECMLDLVRFDQLLEGCDLCVTGEGHADAQSAHGKVVSGVAARCRRAGVPCVAVVGGMDRTAVELFDIGVNALVPTVVDVEPLESALEHAEDNYRLAANRLFALLKLGQGIR